MLTIHCLECNIYFIIPQITWTMVSGTGKNVICVVLSLQIEVCFHGKPFFKYSAVPEMDVISLPFGIQT